MFTKRLLLAAAFAIVELALLRYADAAGPGITSSQEQPAFTACSPFRLIAGIVANTESRSGAGFESHPVPGATPFDPIDVEIVFTDATFASGVVVATSETPASGTSPGFGAAIIKARTSNSVIISAASNNPYQVNFAALRCTMHD
jgi:hypothetical protein